MIIEGAPTIVPVCDAYDVAVLETGITQRGVPLHSLRHDFSYILEFERPCSRYVSHEGEDRAAAARTWPPLINVEEAEGIGWRGVLRSDTDADVAVVEVREEIIDAPAQWNDVLAEIKATEPVIVTE
jgi:hypothetical protein